MLIYSFELSEVCNHSLLSCRQSKTKNWFSLTSRSAPHGSSVADQLIEYGNRILDYNFLHKHAMNKTIFRCKKHLHIPTMIFLLSHSISFTLWQIISYLTHREADHQSTAPCPGCLDKPWCVMYVFSHSSFTCSQDKMPALWELKTKGEGPVHIHLTNTSEMQACSAWQCALVRTS